MITNIIDRRTNQYDILCDAVFEPSWHDNNVRTPGTIFPEDKTFSYDELPRTAITAAIRYANEKWPSVPTTMYLYDWESLTDKEVSDGVFSYPAQPGPFELSETEFEDETGC